MSEVLGIGANTNPENIPNDPVNALKGVTGLIGILQDSLTVQQSILKVLVSKSGSTSTNPKDIKNDALIANTLALTQLSGSITNASLDITVNGLDSGFFSQLMKYTSNSRKLTGLETFSKVFESAVKRMGSLDKYVKSIDNVSAAMLGVFGTFKEFGKGLAFFAAGLALLGLTIITFMEAITVEDLGTFLLTMLTIRLASEIVGKGSYDMAKISIGIAVLGLAVWAFTEVVTKDMAWEFMSTVTIIGASVLILNKLTSSASKNAANSIKGAIAIAAIAGAVWVLNKAIADFEPIDLVLTAEMALATYVFSKLFSSIGPQLPLIAQGALSAAAIGAGIWILSKGMMPIGDIDITLQQGLTFAAIAIASGGIFAAIAPIAPLIIVGALAAVSVGAGIWTLANGLQAISKVSVTENQAATFAKSVGYAIDAILPLGNPLNIPLLAVAVPASIAIASSTWALSKSMNVIASMQLLTSTQYDNFAYGISRIVDSYSSISGIGLVRAGVGAGVIMLVAGASVMTALAINAFSKISESPDAVNTAVLSLDTFVTGISASFEKNKGKFKSIAPGIESFFGVSSMMKEIAQTVQSISNMEFLEKEVRNGKVVTIGVRKFTPSDFANVGNSIGQILMALTEPLAQMSSKKDTFSIGGYTITNPFSNKVQEGISTMQGVGAIFTPIANILKTFSQNKIDSSFIASFNKNLANVLTGISTAFSSDNIDIDEDIVDNISYASKALTSVINQTMNPKFTKGSQTFKVFTGDLSSIKNSLNGMDLAKLTKFTSMLTQLNDLQKSDSMKELVAVFKEFIESFISFTDRQQSSSLSTSAAEPSNPISNLFTKQSGSTTVVQTEPKVTPVIDNENVEALLQDIYDYLVTGRLIVSLSDK